MRRNQKLTKVLQGRAVTDIRREPDATFVTFNDGAIMKIKTAVASDAQPQSTDARNAPTQSIKATIVEAKSNSTKQAAMTGEPSSPAPDDKAGTKTPREQKVKAVSQQETHFSLDFEDGTALTLETREESSSVMLRDKSGAMEYAD